MQKVIALILLVFSFTNLLAQEEDNDWKLSKPVGQTTKDSIVKPGNASFQLPSTGKQGKVTVQKDNRIDGLTEFVGTPQNGKVNVTMKGYRIQAYLDKDKNKVNQLRAQYLSAHSEQPAYIDFLAPNFRLRIGDFRTKLDASAYLEQIKVIFPDAIIVMDDIELPKY